MSETLTLSIESTGIRAAIVRGRRVVKWAESALPAGAVMGGAVVDPTSVSNVLKGLLGSLKVGRIRPIVSVNGMRSFYRYLIVPKMERSLLDRAVLHDLEGSVHVPQDQLYITWTRVRGSGDEDHVFVVASPRSTIDSIIQTVCMAGLKTPVLDCKPLALARLVGVKDAVLVDIEADVLHFVVVKHGRPLIIRTVPLGNWSAVDLSEQLREEIDTTLRLYESTYPEDPVTTGMSVYLSGAGVRVVKSTQVLSDELQRPVEMVKPVLRHPPSMPWPDQAANEGLALRLTAPLRARYSSVPSIDILPSSYRPAPRPIKQMVLGPVAALGILVVALFYQAYDQAIARSELAAAQMNVVQKQMRAKQAEAKKLNELQQTLMQIEAALRTIQEERNILVPDKPQFVGTLNAVYSQAGDQIMLSAVSQSDGKLLINGAALDHRGVLSFVDRLTASKAFSKVDIRESSIVLLTDEQQDGVYRFGSGEEVRVLVKGDAVTLFTIAATR